MLIFASEQKSKRYEALIRKQRYIISIMYGKKIPMVQIASMIGVNKSTISREISRNRDEINGTYDSAKAQAKCEARQKTKSRFHRLTEKMNETIVTKLCLDEKVAQALNIKIFFAKAYHSWKRGANENTNGLYQQYIPKGSDFQTLDRNLLSIARLMINSRPRKRLDFLSLIQKLCRIFAFDNKFLNIVKKNALAT